LINAFANDLNMAWNFEKIIKDNMKNWSQVSSDENTLISKIKEVNFMNWLWNKIIWHLNFPENNANISLNHFFIECKEERKILNSMKINYIQLTKKAKFVQLIFEMMKI
jgi:hypothetical protein